MPSASAADFGSLSPCEESCSAVSHTPTSPGSVRACLVTYGPPPVTLTSATMVTRRSHRTR